MEKTAGVKIDSYKTLKEVLKERIRYFDSVGCLACDHSFSYIPYEKCGEDELEEIFRKGAAGEKPTEFECDCYKTDLLTELAKRIRGTRLGHGAARRCSSQQQHKNV